jgi:hypothetical protein
MRRGTAVAVLMLAATAAGGCAFAELRKPGVAEATCGRVPLAPWWGPERVRQEIDAEVGCIEEYQRQGYRLTRN